MDTFSRSAGAPGSSPIVYNSLACHFWPPEPTLQRSGQWRPVGNNDWCGQWSYDGASKFGHALPGIDVVVPAPVVNVHAAEPLVIPAAQITIEAALVPAPIVNVQAAEPLVLPSPAVNIAAAQITVPAPVVNVNAPQGAPATIEIGTITTLPPGQPAAVRNRGTEGKVILDFDIPRGDKGNPGNGP